MHVLEAIHQRREITHFRPDPLPPEIQSQLENALFLAPTGNNTLSRRFIWVRSRARLDQLSQTTPYMPWLREAAMAVVVLAEPAASKYWLQDATLAGAFLWLAAVDLGVGMAWGALYPSEDAEESRRREEYVRRLLHIPEQFRVIAIWGLGWLKEVAPSDRLRRWFGHDPERWEEFRRRYWSELEQHPHAVDVLRQAARHGPVTLLYAAADPVHNQAVVLREFLRHQPTHLSLPAAPVGPGTRPAPGERAKPAVREDRGRSGSSARRPPQKQRTS